MKTALEYLEEVADEIRKRADEYDKKVLDCVEQEYTYRAICLNSIQTGLLEALRVTIDVKQKVRADMVNEEITE